MRANDLPQATIIKLHQRAAIRAAEKIAKGGHTKKQKRKLIADWVQNIKVTLKAGSK